MQGRAAMWLDGIGFAVPVEDKTKSRVAGRVHYVMQPKGPKAQHSGLVRRRHGRLGLHREEGGGLPLLSSGRPASRWRRASSRAATARPAARRVYADPEVLAGTTSSKAVIDAIVECSKIGRPSLPVVIPVTEFRDIFGIALTNMINGADVEARAREGDRAVQADPREEREGLSARAAGQERRHRSGAAAGDAAAAPVGAAATGGAAATCCSRCRRWW